MPQDPNLYGQRPQKKQKKNAALSSSLDFTAQLTSLMASGSSGATTTGRARPSKEPKEDLFRSHTARKREAQVRANDEKLVLKDVAGTEDESRELARAKRNMENKARLYAAMKRGDYVPQDGNEAGPLIDFDRKWAENEEGKDLSDLSSSDDDENDGDDEIIEYEDEFGRLRRGTRAEKERMERRARRGLLGAEELDRMSARPAAPSNLIHGDAIQAMAFNPDDPDKMEELARKRDRSATPPDMKHYDADKEFRTKGVGFYKFSKDEETRKKEMEALEEERKKTEGERQVRDDQKAARRKEIEERRRNMEARRAKKQADSFLSGMGDYFNCCRRDNLWSQPTPAIASRMLNVQNFLRGSSSASFGQRSEREIAHEDPPARRATLATLAAVATSEPVPSSHDVGPDGRPPTISTISSADMPSTIYPESDDSSIRRRRRRGWLRSVWRRIRRVLFRRPEDKNHLITAFSVSWANEPRSELAMDPYASHLTPSQTGPFALRPNPPRYAVATMFDNRPEDMTTFADDHDDDRVPRSMRGPCIDRPAGWFIQRPTPLPPTGGPPQDEVPPYRELMRPRPAHPPEYDNIHPRSVYYDSRTRRPTIDVLDHPRSPYRSARPRPAQPTYQLTYQPWA